MTSTRALLLAPLLLLAPVSGAGRSLPSDREVAAAVTPSVVAVSLRFQRDARPGQAPILVNVQRPGSGFIVGSSGLIVTNAHLVAGTGDGEYWPVVTLPGGRSYPATVLAVDERTDLALLKLEVTSGRDFPALALEDPAGHPAGERVMAISMPDSSGADLFAGVLAFPAGPVTLREHLLEVADLVISDARFHESLDGGPLVDPRGRVIGIHNSSHISARPPGFNQEEGEEKPEESTDYAVIVSAAAIQAAFGEQLSADGDPAVFLDEATPSPAVAPIASAASAVVSVWTGAADEFPAATDPGDPLALRLPSTLGSGVVLDAAGLVVTAAILLEDEDKDAFVRLNTGEIVPAQVLQIAPASKVALLRLTLPEGTSLEAADLSRAEAPVPGEPIEVLGRPHGAALTLSVGVLSNAERDGLVQVASWVHPGHWGGAIVDGEGRLLGIAVDLPEAAHGVTHESYLGFAAPISRLREVFKEHWQAPETSASELPIGPVSRVAELTHGALVNVLVSQVIEQESTGFNPFGDDVEEEFKLLGQGSGVIIDGSGLALTNWHVVDASLGDDGRQSDRFQVEVTTADDRRFFARVLSTSRDDDLALIALELAEGERLPTVELGSSASMRPGDPVVAIGNPHGLSNSVCTGVVSALDQTMQIRGRLRAYHGMLQTDAAINPGNSGGALLDLQGRLIGINSAGRTGAGLAITVDRAREVFRDKLLSVEQLKSSYLGLEAAAQDGAMHVSSVDPSGPAAAAGLKVGDQLVQLGGTRISDEISYAQAQLSARAWTSLEVLVQRGEEQHAFELTPHSYASWRAFRQSGVQVAPLDYATERELVQRAGVLLHRAYTGDPEGEPKVLMGGALRVLHVQPLDEDTPMELQAGDLVLGMTTRIRGASFDREELARFEDLASLAAAFEPLATSAGGVCTCWVLRGDDVLTVEVQLRRVR